MFVGTHWPNPHPIIAGGYVDKVLHFSAFFVLSVLVARTLQVHGFALDRRVLFAAWGLLAFYGMIDELLQPPFGRSCELADWLADLVGAAAGFALYQKLFANRLATKLL